VRERERETNRCNKEGRSAEPLHRALFESLESDTCIPQSNIMIVKISRKQKHAKKKKRQKRRTRRCECTDIVAHLCECPRTKVRPQHCRIKPRGKKVPQRKPCLDDRWYLLFRSWMRTQKHNFESNRQTMTSNRIQTAKSHLFREK
jgi:hypothetical protein